MTKNVFLLMCRCVFCTLLFSATVFGQIDSGTVSLFEKTNLSEWDFHTDKEGVEVGDVYSFSGNGLLMCQGKPFGWLGTKEVYKNFQLSVEYRWSPGATPTNSGIFLRLNKQPEKTFLPRCVEVQLAPERVGDLYGFHGMKLPAPDGVAKDRASARDGGETFGLINGLKKTANVEKKPEEWNTLDILCSNGLIVVAVNGKIVNWVTDAEQTSGKIGFQSEGGPIQFRNAILTVLP
ncbi:MAG: DUF1080 domain-containing protein [Planctomycetaceae bacterium]|jgi:hypothetical protein|nr:DUF1080 domain-containing protein [Planctomycetaceae bacterium]